MSDHEGYGGAHLLLAFIAGGIAGATAALLLAPQSGAETRDALRTWSRDARGRAVRLPEALRRAYRDASEAAKKAFSETFAESMGGPEKS
jgi:gas vesicle protein